MDKMRWRFGDTNSVKAAVDSTTVIEIGDLLWQDVDDAKPASIFLWPDQEYANMSLGQQAQKAFARKFLGAAMQRSPNGEASNIRVATTGVFEFDCPISTFELGDLVGVEWLTGPCKTLLNQRVDKVYKADLAIGRVARRQETPVTNVLVAICSTVMTGGVEGSSPHGV